MVAITVILAAVIGGFVLGLGGDLQSAPQAQISIEAGNSGTIVVSHEGGDAMEASDLRIAGDASGDFETVTGFNGEFSVGDSASWSPGTGEYTIRIIHEPSESVIAEETVDA